MLVESVTLQTDPSHDLVRRPAVGIVYTPLAIAGRLTQGGTYPTVGSDDRSRCDLGIPLSRKPSRPRPRTCAGSRGCKRDELTRTSGRVNLHHSLGLSFARASGPERPERSDGLIPGLLLLLGVVIKVQRLALVPEVLINLVLSRDGTLKPFRRSLLARGRFLTMGRRKGFLGDGEGREVKLVIEFEFVAKDILDGRGNVVLVLRSVSLVRAASQQLTLNSKAFKSIVAKLAHRFSNRYVVSCPDSLTPRSCIKYSSSSGSSSSRSLY